MISREPMTLVQTCLKIIFRSDNSQQILLALYAVSCHMIDFDKIKGGGVFLTYQSAVSDVQVYIGVLLSILPLELAV